MKQRKMERSSDTLLTEEHVYFGGMHLTYRLYVVTGEALQHFCITVSMPGEESRVDVGSDLVRAVEYYSRIKGGTVTPCTLADVVEDLQYA